MRTWILLFDSGAYIELTLRVYKTYYNPTKNKLLTPKNTESRRTITVDSILIALII